MKTTAILLGLSGVVLLLGRAWNEHRTTNIDYLHTRGVLRQNGWI